MSVSTLVKMEHTIEGVQYMGTLSEHQCTPMLIWKDLKGVRIVTSERGYVVNSGGLEYKKGKYLANSAKE